jgi:hypothetical protein
MLRIMCIVGGPNNLVAILPVRDDGWWEEEAR